MDVKCPVCENTSDDSLGACRLCGTPFVPLSKKEKKATEAAAASTEAAVLEPEPELEPVTTGKSKGK